MIDKDQVGGKWAFWVHWGVGMPLGEKCQNQKNYSPACGSHGFGFPLGFVPTGGSSLVLLAPRLVLLIFPSGIGRHTMFWRPCPGIYRHFFRRVDGPYGHLFHRRADSPYGHLIQRGRIVLTDN